jgi:tetratricopeptide (TPR) repeat protein
LQDLEEQGDSLTGNADEAMPRRYPGVMVSSTFSDLVEHRATTIRILEEHQLLPRVMERDSAKADIDIIDSSLAMVEESSAYIGVISHRYGQVPECPKRNPNKLSITELEFNRAQELGRPILLFIMGPGHTGTKSDFETDPDKISKLADFRERAKKLLPGGDVDRVYAVFENLPDFAEKAANAIAHLAPSLHRRYVPTDRESTDRLTSIEYIQPAPDLYGRAEELERVVSAMLNNRPVTIGGGPGFGKTALAVSALYDSRVIEKYGHRRTLVPFDAETDPIALASRILTALGHIPPSDEPSILRRVTEALARSPALIVLDNAESVFDTNPFEAERVLRLISQIHGLGVVLTMRGVPPRLPGGANIEDLPKLEIGPAKEAFLAVAGDYFNDDDNLTALVEILDGHALSIQLVAAQAAGTSTLAGLREAWDKYHAEILRRPDADEGRLTSVRASLALSLSSEKLKREPHARRLLAILSVLPAGVPESEVPALLGERGRFSKHKALNLIALLHKMRLVERRLDGRLRMLTPLRESVRLDGPLFPTDRKRLLHLLTRKIQIGIKAGTTHWVEVRDKILPEEDNFDSICDLAIRYERDRKETFDALIGFADFRYFVAQGPISSLERALDVYKAHEMWFQAAHLSQKMARLRHVRAEYRIARQYYEQAIVLGGRINSHLAKANGLLGLGDIEMSLSQHVEGTKHVEQALELYKQVNDRVGEGNCLNHLAQLVERSGDNESSIPIYLAAKKLFEETGSAVGVANIDLTLAKLNDAKPEIYRDIAESYKSAGSTNSVAQALVQQAKSEAERGSMDRALPLFDKALGIARTMGRGLTEAHALSMRGICVKYYGDDHGSDDDITAGFAIFFSKVSDEDLAQPGWISLKSGLLSKSQSDADIHFAAARSQWEAINRFDLIRDWVPTPKMIDRYYSEH